MQFLKQKALAVYHYSKELIKKPTIEHMNGRQIIHYLTTHIEAECNSAALARLACLSTEFQQYTEVFNYLIDKLQQFTYQPATIKQTLKLLNIVCYLVRNGSEEFVNDFKKNEDLLISFEKINTHQFENSLGNKHAKTLTYHLELIRHRATFIHRMIDNPQLLEEERSKSSLPASLLEQSKGEGEGDQTINGLKIDISFDKSPAKRKTVQVGQKQNKKEEQTQCELVSKSAPKRLSPVLGNKISNEIAT